MTLARDSFCSFCGAAFTPPLAYPRTCASCNTTIWANPTPVAVVLLPVVDGERTGLLVVRRAIEPHVGKLTLVGGFLEEHETWQVGTTREIFEEAGTVIDPETLTPFWFASTAPRPNRVLLFSIAEPIDVVALGAFERNAEASERGLIFGPEGLDELIAFRTHVAATRRYFLQRGITGECAYTVY
jgi:ADP-ribose pyrophosphatase YjhB (NUDIX family)